VKTRINNVSNWTRKKANFKRQQTTQHYFFDPHASKYSSFQNYPHPDNHTRQTTDTPGFKPLWYYGMTEFWWRSFGLKITVLSRATFLVSIGNNINSRVSPVALPTISRALLPMTSKANKLPLETEPIARDNNTIFTLRHGDQTFVEPYSTNNSTMPYKYIIFRRSSWGNLSVAYYKVLVVYLCCLQTEVVPCLGL